MRNEDGETETKRLIRNLETRRHQRKRINDEIRLIVEREAFILERLSDIRDLGISRIETEPPAPSDRLSTSSD